MSTHQTIKNVGARSRGRRAAPLTTVGAFIAAFASTAILAAGALVVPAAAAGRPSVVAQATASMQRGNAVDEAHGLIPFNRGTQFTITCSVFHGQTVVCSEHAGPEQCTNGNPWVLLSDSFPIIGNTIGGPEKPSLAVAYEYCQ